MTWEILKQQRELAERVGELEARHERTIRPGTVTAVDYSDPTKPRARIQHGTALDGTPALGPWLPFSQHAGEMSKWSPLTVGQQMIQFCPDGVLENGILVPLGHSSKVPAPSNDPDRHVTQFGDHRTDHGKEDHTRTIGGTSVHQDKSDHKVNVPGKAEVTAGDPAAAASSGAGSLGSFPHELNRIVQGFAARLDQHENFHAAHHDGMSTMLDLLLPKNPQLAALAPMLNHQPQGLQMLAEGVLGKLPSFSASSIAQTLGKLLGGSPLGAVTEILQANASSALSGLLTQATSALSSAGVSSPALTAALTAASSSVSAAASGGTFELGVQLANLTSLSSGTAAAAPIAAVVAQMQTLMGSTASLMGGLSGLLDGQVNATKGTIKSYLLGGYGS